MLTMVHAHSALSWWLEVHAYPPLVKIFLSTLSKQSLVHNPGVDFEGLSLNPVYMPIHYDV